jgi:hypothetical protein
VSGLIVAGIVAIWVVVLVPMWLNRHDAANASRSMDTFSTAMRVLSRRQQSGNNSGGQRYVVMPQRENWGLTVDNRPDSRPASKAQLRKAQKAFRGKAGLIERRRRLGIGLVTLVMVTAVVSVLGYTPWLANGIADVLAVLFVVHLRGQARRAQQFTSRRSAQPAAVADAGFAGRTSRTAAYRRPAAGIEASIRAGYAEEQAVVSASAAGTANGSRWEPVPVPLPTYVSKPVVKRPAARVSTPVPVVDLTKPGGWTDGDIDVRHLLLDETGSGTMSASEGAASVSASAERARPAITFEDEELDQILSRRRAVND